jgi:lysylphosphatidylglycerol synthetase-like protein (DUF2156 family)
MTQSNRSSVTVCVAVGCTVGLLVFLAVAPFECEDNGICHGFLAFDYGRDSRGPWQAVGAGALVGAVAAILLFAVLAQGRAKSVLSQSILFVLGPLICGLVLWGLWKGNASASANAEPPPFYDRAN